jgi:hypothetical protein
MKSVKYEGFIPVCIIIQLESSPYFKEKIYGFSLLNLKWMKKWQEEARDNQFPYTTIMEEDNKFNCASGKHRDNYVRFMFIDQQYLTRVTLWHN